jgi:putative ABC transport system substrate-binding protein
LRELGWKPGTDLLIEYRYAEGGSDRLAELAAELVRLKVNVIVTRGSQATREARAKTATIPIVMAVVSDPVANGFASTLMRPGGNATGLSFLASGDFEAKQIKMLKEALPELTRVVILTNPLTWPDPAGLLMRDVRVAAGSLGLKIEAFMVRAPSELPEAFAAITRAHMEALLVRMDPQL